MASPHRSSAWGNPKPAYLDCRRPRSFYELVEELSEGTNSEWVLHRVANLLRKYEQSTDCPHLVARVQWHPQGLPAFALENKHLSRVNGEPVTSDCLALTVFTEDVDESRLDTTPADALLAHCIVKRNHGIVQRGEDIHAGRGNVWEAVLRPNLLLNNFLNGIRTYTVPVGTSQFAIDGIYFSQQNRLSAKCAQSALAMALRAMEIRTKAGEEITPADVAERIPGALGEGLTLTQMVQVLRTFGLKPMAIDFQDPSARGLDYRSLVHAGVESGLPVLLAFVTRDRRTGEVERHVVTVLGHTLNTDTWVAEAEFGYGVASDHKYHPSYDWCTHWLINDDNLGMVYCLQANRLTSPWAGIGADSQGSRHNRLLEWLLRLPRRRWIQGRLKEFHVFGVIVPLPVLGPVDVKGAEIKTLEHLSDFTKALAERIEGNGALLALPQAQWILRLQKRLSKTHPGPGPILRSRLLDRSTYLEHLRIEQDWNGKSVDETIVSNVSAVLPTHFWMTEFTLVDLFTANRRKLGEVLWEPEWSKSEDMSAGLLMTRFPGMVKIHVGNTTRVTNCWSHVAMLSTAKQGDRY